MFKAGTIHDKEIKVFDHKLPGCNEKTIQSYLIQFNRLETLRKLAEISCLTYNNHSHQIKNVPVTPYLLHQAVCHAANYCADDGNKIPSNDDIAYLIRAEHALDDKQVDKNEDANELWMRQSYKQFPFQEPQFHALARTIYIYRDLWPRVEKATNIKPLDEIYKIIGIPFEAAIYYSFAVVGNKSGYLFEYCADDIDKIAEKLEINIPHDSHKTFLQWVSDNYAYISAGEQQPGLSPLVKRPVIKTQAIPPNNDKEVYITGSYHYMLQKCSYGFFHDLADAFNMGKKENSFRESFGHVFEAYIGELLTSNLKCWKISPEIIYKKGKTEVRTSDWLLTRGDRAILIDVKLTSLTLEAKSTGNYDLIKHDLKKSLIKAVEQLKTTIEDARSKEYPELNGITAKHFQCIVVFYDALLNANWIGREIVDESIGELPFDLHILNITDFEDFIANIDRKEKIYSLLEEKAKWFKEFDFKEFMIRKFKKSHNRPQILEEAYQSFFKGDEK